LYDKSCGGKRSGSITERCVTGVRARGGAEALMEATAERRHRTPSGWLGSRVYARQDLRKPPILSLSLLDMLIAVIRVVCDISGSSKFIS